MELRAEKAFVKTFHKKVGQGKTRLGVVIPMTPKTARDLGFFSAVYQQDGTPKQEILEVKLEVAKARDFNFRLEVLTLPEKLIINTCDEATDFVAKRKGATKKGKASRLMLEFKVAFRGASVGVYEWLEKYGLADGTLTIASTGPEQINLSDPASRRKKPEKPPAETEAQASPAPSTTEPAADTQTVASMAAMRMKGTVQ